jgi:hypothetical protein|tara:strand:- start:3411 stop:3542 length:132 start_codon:yes stop_codon:yes gene_type:complete
MNDKGPIFIIPVLTDVNIIVMEVVKKIDFLILFNPVRKFMTDD